MTSNVTPTENPGLSVIARSTLQAAAVLGTFLLAGAVCGVLWHAVWDPPTGVVFEQTWNITSEDGLRTSFSATGWFVVLSAVAGLSLGLLAGLLTRERELISLAAVAVGSVLAAVLMWRLGLTLAAPDPTVLARRAAEGTMLEGRIGVGGWSPFLAFPIAAIFGLLIPFVLVPGRDNGVPTSPTWPYAEPNVAQPLSQEPF